MISPVLALALLSMAPSDPNPMRKAFAACLKDFLQTSLDKHVAIDAFDTALASACADKENAFRTAAIAFDVSHGVSRKTSEQGVADEVVDFRSSIKERYELLAEAAAPAASAAASPPPASPPPK